MSVKVVIYPQFGNTINVSTGKSVKIITPKK